MNGLRRTPAIAALALLLLLGCSSGPEGSNGPEAVHQDTNATAPAPEVEDGASVDPAPLTASPGCGTPGRRVLLKLGADREGHAPDCYRPEDFAVEFAPAVPARITMLGPTNEGFCAVDVLVPEGAETGAITVVTGDVVFESATAFRVPCN